MRHLNLVSIGIIGLFLVSSCSDVVHRVGTVDFKQSYDLKHKGNGTEIMSDGGPLFVIDTLERNRRLRQFWEWAEGIPATCI